MPLSATKRLALQRDTNAARAEAHWRTAVAFREKYTEKCGGYLANVLAAAEAGHKQACYTLGKMLCDGHHSIVEQNYARARAMFKRAGDYGNGRALRWLGYLYQRALGGGTFDWHNAFRCYKRGARLGDVLCAFNAARAYLVGEGTPRDPAKAIELWTWCAERGDEEAKDCLARRYYTGTDVQQDKERALAYWRSCGPGFVRARVSMATARLLDDSTDWNDERQEDLRILREKADNFNMQALEGLAMCYRASKHVPRDDEAALRYMTLATCNNNPAACYVVSRMHELGIGTLPNATEAAHWRKQARAHSPAWCDANDPRWRRAMDIRLDFATPERRYDLRTRDP